MPQKLPWFLNCIVSPPADPLTVQLLAAVAGLESVPGPKTIGPENYSVVSAAFLARGWAGFEETFDAIVPRARPDYAAVKRELLRETIFNPVVHLRMSRIFLGETTIEETLKEIARERPPAKPQ
jgi:hypothetical protein